MSSPPESAIVRAMRTTPIGRLLALLGLATLVSACAVTRLQSPEVQPTSVELMDVALDRAKAYADAGADAILIHHIKSDYEPVLDFADRWYRTETAPQRHSP